MRVGKLPMSAVNWREATDETQGLMKVLVGADDECILGLTVIGADAGEVVVAMHTGTLAEPPSRRCTRTDRSRLENSFALVDVTYVGQRAVSLLRYRLTPTTGTG